MKRFKYILIIVFEIIIILSLYLIYKKSSSIDTEYYFLSKNRFDMIQAADRLRHSSDELTHFARIYVITGNEKFKQQYFDVLDIRNGTKPRPQSYYSIYWDLNSSLRTQRHPDGDKESLWSIISHLPFTQEEMDILKTVHNIYKYLYPPIFF